MHTITKQCSLSTYILDWHPKIQRLEIFSIIRFKYFKNNLAFCEMTDYFIRLFFNIIYLIDLFKNRYILFLILKIKIICFAYRNF